MTTTPSPLPVGLRRWCALVALAPALWFAGLPLQAANAVPSSPPTKAAEPVVLADVIVTGSAIPMAERETFSPMAVFSATEMMRRGASTTIETLRTMPGFAGAVNTEQRTNGGTGNASVNFRALAGTLTLLEGHRTAAFDNYNSIPITALQRIEVVKDGASAIYGADALSGVFNTMLIPRFTGEKIDLYYGNTTDADAGVMRAGLLAGAAHGGTDIVVAGEYYHRNALYSIDREVSAEADGRARGGKNQGSAAFSGRVTARVGGTTAPVQDLVLKPGLLAGFTAADYVPIDVNPTTSNQLLNFRGYTSSIPKQTHASAYARLNQKLGTEIEAHARLLYTHDIFYGGLAAAPMPTTGAAATALRNAARLSPHIPTGLFLGSSTDNATSSGGGLIVGTEPFRTLVMGPRTQTYTRDAWDFTAGLHGRLPHDWAWNADYIYSDFYRHYLQAGAPGRAKLVAHILDGSYNPFASDSAVGTNPNNSVKFDNPAALADSAAQGLISQHTPIRGFAANASGSAYTLPAGEIKVGVGGDYYRNYLSDIPEAIFFSGDLVGLSASNPTISRGHGGGVFAEMQVPLIGPSMMVPAVHGLSLSLGGRRDEQTVEGYANGSSGPLLSRTFTTNNPKIGLRWMVTDDLLIRSTWGTGFRLPALSQLFAAASSFSAQLTDPLGFFIPTQTTVSTGGNPNLDPEKSKTYSYGAVFSPKAVPGFSVSLDYYFGEIKGLTGEGAQYILNVNAAGQGTGFVRGNAATLNPQAPFANRITRSATGSVQSVASSNFNISSRKTTGLDYAITYVWPERELGKLTTRADWNTVLTWDLTPVAGLPPQSFVGVFIDTNSNAISPGSVPKQKGTLSQSWEKGAWGALVSANYISRLRDDPNFSTVTGAVRYISDWTTVDAQVAYTFSGGAGWRGWLAKTTVRLGGANLFDRAAPFAAGAQNDSYDVKTHSSRGRFLYTEITKQF